MPILNLKISGERSVELNQKLVKTLGHYSGKILGKKPEVTAITITYIAKQDWYIAGKSLLEHEKNSFYLDIKITDETNIKQEKAHYIEAIFNDLAQIIAPCHEESYIYVEDVRAAAYGYGGKTQEYRYHHPN